MTEVFVRLSVLLQPVMAADILVDDDDDLDVNADDQGLLDADENLTDDEAENAPDDFLAAAPEPPNAPAGRRARRLGPGIDLENILQGRLRNLPGREGGLN